MDRTKNPTAPALLPCFPTSPQAAQHGAQHGASIDPGDAKPWIGDIEFEDTKLDTTIKLPTDGDGRFPGTHVLTETPVEDEARERAPESTGFFGKVRPIGSLIAMFTISLIFFVPYFLFIYFVLIQGIVETPGVFWDASKTNYVVSVLSQLSALLTDATLRALLSALRPALASSSNGTSFATYVGLGASDWLSAIQVAVASWFLNPWCDFRLSLPVMSLAFGSILKFQATFQYYFLASNATMNIYAGLIPPDARVLNAISPADGAMYFSTWSSSLLTNSRFALEFRLDGCDDDCRSIILPGSLELARRTKPALNESVFFGSFFDGSDTIRINNATGMIVKFEIPDSNLTFDIVKDCVYAGETIDNGLQVCIQQHGQSMDVAWAACPKSLLDANLCNENSTWRSERMTSSTRMSAYQVFTTTSYAWKNASIVDIQGTSKPRQLNLSAADYTKIFEKILVAREDATPNDIHNINSFIYLVTWMHRTYSKSFPDDKSSSVTNLHNVLSVPIQFTVNAWIYANYTASEKGLASRFDFSLPNDMITTATGGQSSSRLAILPWAGWLFVGAEALLHLVVFCCIFWILRNKEPLPHQIGIQELDIIISSSQVTCLTGKRRNTVFSCLRRKPVAENIDDGPAQHDSPISLMDFAQLSAIPDTTSTWRLARLCQDLRVALDRNKRGV